MIDRFGPGVGHLNYLAVLGVGIQWNPAIMKCHGTTKIVHYSGVFVPVITNYLVNSKNICYSGVTKLNQAEEWDIHHSKQSTDLRINSYI